MALAFAHRGVLYLVLDEENVDRIREYDPFDFNQRNAGAPLALKVPLEIVVAYARKDEQERIARMVDPDEVVKYLRRGYKETASDGERAVPYLTLKKM